MPTKFFIKLPALPLRSSALIFFILVISAIVTVFATPKFQSDTLPKALEDIVPLKLGQWENMPNPYAQVSVSTYTQNLSDNLYDQVLMRTYQNNAGDQVMLALAYAREQRQDIKIHQPEICYPAQGYKISSIKNQVLNIQGYAFPIQGKRLIFTKDNRMEAVTYWIRLGDDFPLTGFEMRWKILMDGIKGKLDDGMLVRVSTIINEESDAAAAYTIHEKFLSEVLNRVQSSAPGLLVPH